MGIITYTWITDLFYPCCNRRRKVSSCHVQGSINSYVLHLACHDHHQMKLCGLVQSWHPLILLEDPKKINHMLEATQRCNPIIVWLIYFRMPLRNTKNRLEWDWFFETLCPLSVMKLLKIDWTESMVATDHDKPFSRSLRCIFNEISMSFPDSINH